MAKLKDHIIKQEEHSRLVFDNLRDALAKAKETNHKYNSDVHKHQPEKQQSTQTWSENMPDLEGQALADAEKQFDYDSWLGKHGYGEATAQDDNPYLFNPTRSKTEWLTPRTMLRLNKIKHGIGE
jgi:hypothetical protein